MNIIIAGCGKVGLTLGEQLVAENHEVTFIDSSQEKLQKVVGMLDVQVLLGNCTVYSTLREAGIEHADLFIAVTNSDEINLLSCLIAKKAANCHTVARVRNPEYNEDIQFIKSELGLSLTINPEWASAVEIARLIQIPSAMEANSFAGNHVNMIRFVIPENSILNNMKIADIGHKYSNKILVCVIERNHEILIPSGDIILKSGDSISVIIPLASVNHICTEIGIDTKPIKNVTIAGGGTISYYLAKLLIRMNVSVKIIELDRKRCEELSSLLPKALIINGDATDSQLLAEEGVSETDAFVALTGFDEENLLLSLHTHKISKAKNIIKINRINFDEVIGELNVGSVIYPKNITTEFITQYVRAMENSMGNSVETLYKLMENKVEALEFKVKDTPGITGIQLQDLELKKNLIICCINRHEKIITPTGRDMILEGDSVIVVTTHLGLKNLCDILI
ncbi:MAG: Trk system potassium transporter TrkA [Lachnospiraceae bacterium]|nr:Trk system potassium transporter TrkA [Lachnospiraceae bacterium]